MKNSQKIFNSAGQRRTQVKKPQKHDTNLQKNSTVYFQIGLILCLLGTYALFEMQFQEHRFVVSSNTAKAEKIYIEYVKAYVVEVIHPKDSQPLPSKELNDVFKAMKNDTPIIETIVHTPDGPLVVSEPVELGDIKVIEEPVGTMFVDFIKIENAPIYPGCEKHKANDERKKCMSQKIDKLVIRKFNTDIASEYGLSGVQKIYTQFTIDKNGNVVDIKARAPHPALEKEAQRIIDKIPHMKPGYQRDVAVGVIYNLPITFQVQY
jgi:protein TonB